MLRERTRTCGATLLWTILGLIALVAAAGRPALGADRTLLLEVVINDYSTQKIGTFVQRDGALYAKASDLEDVGLRVPASIATTADGLVKVSDLPGITARLDQPGQTLQVTGRSDRLMPTVLQTPGGRARGEVESSLGATLNYDVLGTAVSDPAMPNILASQNALSGQFDFRVFSPWGVLSTGALGYLGPSTALLAPYSAVRLDTTYTYSDPDEMLRVRAGDFISGSLPWTRAVRLGGGQVQRDFGLRPDLITFPLPSMAGSVAVPSTVDVLIDNAQVLSRNVQPGPFQVPQLPVVSGAGYITMAVTNSLGRQVLAERPFYASSLLLAQDLDSFSIEGGLVRLNWGFVSNDYGTGAGSATYRRGIYDWLTVEGHAEGGPSLAMGGVGVVVNLFDLAVLNLAAAASSSAGPNGNQTGSQFTAGIQRIGRRWSVAASVSRASSGFADIAAINGQPVQQLLLSASAGVSLDEFGSIAVAYNAINSPATQIRLSSSLGQFAYMQPALNTQLLSATYTLQLWNSASLYATAYNDFSGYSGSGVLVGLTVPLGTRSAASVSASSTTQDRSAQVQLQQNSFAIGDVGYRLFAGASQVSGGHQFAQVEYKSPWALLLGGVDRYGDQTTLQASARGAVSVIGGGVFASNQILDSFAVVDTSGFKNVRVQHENRPYGVTDSGGQLLVPELRSFDVNQISIDPTDVPADASVTYDKRTVRPQDRSGVVVRFPIETSRGALVQLMDEAGQPVPVGSIATLASNRKTVPVGHDGKAYLTGLEARNEVTVERRNGRRCVATFAYQPKTGDIPAIGPVQCREGTR